MTDRPGRFGDLLPRLGSGIVLSVTGGGAVWLGGVWFVAFVTLAVGLMLWELAIMQVPQLDRTRAALVAVLAGAGVPVSALMPSPFAIAWALLPAAISVLLPRGARAIFAVHGGLLVLAGGALVGLRMDFGVIWLLWLLLVVIASDIAGYFAGKALGGPKFWPRVSPKKTWAGTVAGWGAAALVGAAFAGPTGAGAALVAWSLVVALAGQAGDIAESALKRAAGVKDSSALIPGHGGVMDRFDAMMAAALAFLVIDRLGLVAPAAGG